MPQGYPLWWQEKPEGVENEAVEQVPETCRLYRRFEQNRRDWLRDWGHSPHLTTNIGEGAEICFVSSLT